MKDIKAVKKHLNASSCLKYIIIIFIVLVCIFNIFFHIGYKKVLTISHQETNQVFIKKTVDIGNTLEYKWIHSFEHIPWTEEFEILENNHLLLHKIMVAGFGAGIPENKGNVNIENGIIVMSEIEQEFSEINWFNSNTALEHISINGIIIIKGSDLPHHQKLNLSVKEMLLIWPRFH